MSSKFIIYSDFDNTITNYDILDKIIEEKYSYDKYKEVENLLLLNEMNYENYLLDLFQGIEYDLHDISKYAVDSTFNTFYNWTKTNNIDFYIVSSGFKAIINHLIPYVDYAVIFGNDIQIRDNKWIVKLFDEANHSSTDKNNIIKLLGKPEHKTIFIGDGLSDFKVMGMVDYLFCKNNSLLHTKCMNESHDHIVFNDFSDVLHKIKFLFEITN
jgi:HAD superfamily phosphoserine phosphatase-like hydrolase